MTFPTQSTKDSSFNQCFHEWFTRMCKSWEMSKLEWHLVRVLSSQTTWGEDVYNEDDTKDNCYLVCLWVYTDTSTNLDSATPGLVTGWDMMTKAISVPVEIQLSLNLFICNFCSDLQWNSLYQIKVVHCHFSFCCFSSVYKSKLNKKWLRPALFSGRSAIQIEDQIENMQEDQPNTKWWMKRPRGYHYAPAYIYSRCRVWASCRSFPLSFHSWIAIWPVLIPARIISGLIMVRSLHILEMKF